MPRPLWENPRVQLLDDIWLLTIVAILVATGLPWFASGFDVDVGTASWGLLALGGIHVAFTLLTSPGGVSERWRERALLGLDVLGIMLVGFIWAHVGALQNPMFLTVFSLPVVGGIFLSRWHPYLLALVGIGVVALVALIQVPELRWYVTGLVHGNSLLALMGGNQRAAVQSTFAGFYAPLNYTIVLLEVFAILLLACAVVAEYIGTVFERLNANVGLARAEAERGQKIWAELIEKMPLPALLVDPYTMRIGACSALAASYLEAGDLPLEGRNLIDALLPTYADVVNDLINGADGEARATVIRVAGRQRITNMRVLHIAHKERRLALLTIEDATGIFCLEAALDSSDYAALVIDAQGRVLAFNKLANGLFGSLAPGADAGQLLVQSDSGVRWWDPGIAGRRKMHVQIGPRIYQITSSAIAPAGEEERIFTVALLPVASAAAAEAFGSGTIITNLAGRIA